jgi:hypothetical protein
MALIIPSLDIDSFITHSISNIKSKVDELSEKLIKEYREKLISYDHVDSIYEESYGVLNLKEEFEKIKMEEYPGSTNPYPIILNKNISNLYEIVKSKTNIINVCFSKNIVDNCVHMNYYYKYDYNILLIDNFGNIFIYNINIDWEKGTPTNDGNYILDKTSLMKEFKTPLSKHLINFIKEYIPFNFVNIHHSATIPNRLPQSVSKFTSFESFNVLLFEHQIKTLALQEYTLYNKMYALKKENELLKKRLEKLESEKQLEDFFAVSTKSADLEILLETTSSLKILDGCVESGRESPIE